MLKNFIFDLGGVLFDEHNGATIDPIRKASASEGQFKALWSNMLLGRMTMKECHDYLIKQDEANREILAGTMDDDFYLKNLSPIQENINTVKALSKERNVYVLSNATNVMRDYTVKCLGIPGYIRGVYSCGVGLMKPDLQLYKLALQHFELNPNETIFFDDRPKNLYAAGMCGIKTSLVTQDNFILSLESILS